jgi:hypothetical protein
MDHGMDEITALAGRIDPVIDPLREINVLR